MLRQLRFNIGEHLVNQILGAVHSVEDTFDYLLEKIDSAVLLAYCHLPVPLVDIERVDVVEFLVGTNGIHIGVDAIAALDAIIGKNHTFPLGKRVDNLRLLVVHVFHRERYRTLNSVQVIVQSSTFQHKKRCRYTPQVQLRRQVRLEKIFYPLYAQLCLCQVQNRFISRRNIQFAHFALTFVLDGKCNSISYKS